MTILIGVLLEKSVLFLSDTLRNNMNADGSILGVETMEAQKIRKIRTNVMMASAGIGTQGNLATELIGSIIGNDRSITTAETLKCCFEILNFTRNTFIKYNPHANYNKLAALIGGIDDSTKTPYLYMTHSDCNFKMIKSKVISIGVQPEATVIETNIKKYMEEFPNENSETYALAFAKILRDSVIGSKVVGQNVFILEIRNNNTQMSGYLNENGDGIPIPKHFIL